MAHVAHRPSHPPSWSQPAASAPPLPGPCSTRNTQRVSGEQLNRPAGHAAPVDQSCLLSGLYSQRGEGHGGEQGRRPAEQAALSATAGGGRLAAGSLALCPDRHHPAWRSSSMAAGGAADRPGESCATGQHCRGTGGLAGVPDGNPVPSQDGLPGRMVQWEAVLPCRSTMGGMGCGGALCGCCSVGKMAAKYVIGEQRCAAARRRHPSLRPVPLLSCSPRERHQLIGRQTGGLTAIAIAAMRLWPPLCHPPPLCRRCRLAAPIPRLLRLATRPNPTPAYLQA